MSGPRADLLVVGGGPAGSLLAFLAARAGLRVRLFERARFPRPKPCGGVLGPRAVAALEEAGLLTRVRGSGAEPIRLIHVVRPDGGLAILPFGEGLALAREDLDACLLEAAASAGVEVMTGTQVEGVGAGSGRAPVWLQVRTPSGAAQTHHAPWVAGAGGSHCPIRRLLGPAGRGTATGCAVAVSAILEGSAAAPGVCEMHLLGSGYCGVAAAGRGRTTVGMVLPAAAWRGLGAAPERAHDPALERALEAALEAHPSLAGRFRPLAIAAGPWASGSLRAQAPARVPAGFLLIGDALARQEPITGEGMAEAMDAAHRVARWIAAHPDPALAPELHRRLVRAGRASRRRSALAGSLSRAPRAARVFVSWARRVPALARLAGRRLGARPAPGSTRPAATLREKEIRG